MCCFTAGMLQNVIILSCDIALESFCTWGGVTLYNSKSNESWSPSVWVEYLWRGVDPNLSLASLDVASGSFMSHMHILLSCNGNPQCCSLRLALSSNLNPFSRKKLKQIIALKRHKYYCCNSHELTCLSAEYVQWSGSLPGHLSDRPHHAGHRSARHCGGT